MTLEERAVIKLDALLKNSEYEQFSKFFNLSPALAELLKVNRQAAWLIIDHCPAQKFKPEFCRHIFESDPAFGLKKLLTDYMPAEHYYPMLNACRLLLPPCQHDNEESCQWKYAPEVRSDGEEGIDILISDWFNLPDAEKNSKPYILRATPQQMRDYKEPAGFGSLLERLKHAAGGPAPELLTADGWHTPDGKLINDLKEPVYVVTSMESARQFSLDLKILERWKKGELSRWYVQNAFYVCDAAAAEAIDEMTSNAQMTGALAWKPVVLTFPNSILEHTLQDLCKQVTTVLPNKDGKMSLAAVRASAAEIKSAEKIGIPDMPETVLDGWLGHVCKERMSAFPIALAWPALLSAASILVPHSPDKRNRTNLFTVLVGGKGTGKSSAFDYALRLLDVQSPPLMKLKVGSAEQLGKKIGDVGGASRLYYTDELEHLLLKAAIQGATFATVLNTAFYEDAQDITISEGKDASMNCRLSVAGGVVDERFNDLFGAATTGGFYDRFVFGVCPSDYAYSYRSFSGEPALRTVKASEDNINEVLASDVDRPVPVEIDYSVWEARDHIAEELKISAADRRVLELGIRCAVIAASFDGRRTLRGSDLGPMKALVEYQRRVRRFLKPNPGKNPHAIVGCKFRDYLDENTTKGNEWISRREMIHSTRAEADWGMVICNSVLKALEMSGDIETKKIGRKNVLRRI